MTFALLRIIEPFTSLHAAKDTGKKIILEAFMNEARMHAWCVTRFTSYQTIILHRNNII